MITLSYISRHLTGTWQMAFNREGWQDKIDRSTEGVFQSFWALGLSLPIVWGLSIVLPPLLPTLNSQLQDNMIVMPLIPGLIVVSIKLILQWLAGLGILVFLSHRLQQNHHIADLIIGYNWAQLIFRGFLALPFIALATTKREEIFAVLALPCLAIAIAVLWGILRRALPNVSPPIIAGLMISLFIATLLIDSFLAIITQGLFPQG